MLRHCEFKQTSYNLFQRRHVEQDGGLPGDLPEGLGQVLYHLPGIFVEQRVMLRAHEAKVVLLRE